MAISIRVFPRESKRARRGLRFELGDWPGSLGDLGTLVPIFLGLVALQGLSPARTLLLVGLVYLASALYFRLPIPVQPFKAMAAILLARPIGLPVLWAAGLWMGGLLLVLGLTGGIERLSRYFTQPIVKGIQLGVGLMLLHAAFKVAVNAHPVLQTSLAPVVFPDGWSFLSSLWLLVIPQLPLTLGNAVYALSDVARHYFGKEARQASPRNIAVSLGLANLFMGFFGGLPVCHGSGGLTAHYRFGARSSGATFLLGGALVVLALLFGNKAFDLIRQIPPWVLGVLLGYVGICHAWLVRGLKEKLWLALSMGLVALLSGNLAVALGLGLLTERWRSGTSSIR